MISHASKYVAIHAILLSLKNADNSRCRQMSLADLMDLRIGAPFFSSSFSSLCAVLLFVTTPASLKVYRWRAYHLANQFFVSLQTFSMQRHQSPSSLPAEFRLLMGCAWVSVFAEIP